MNDPTLPALISVSLTRPREYELVCPRCQGPVRLVAGQYVCTLNGTTFRSLGELVRGKEIGQ